MKAGVYLEDGGLGLRLHRRGGGLSVRGGPAAGHVHTDRKLLQDPHHFLMGLANQRDSVDLGQEAETSWGPDGSRTTSLATPTSNSSSPLNSFPQRPTGPSGRTERM